MLKAKAKDLTFKAKDLTFKAKDSKFVLEDTSRTKAKDNNTGVLLVAGPMAWNSLPDFIRDPTSHTDCFRQWRRNCGDRGGTLYPPSSGLVSPVPCKSKMRLVSKF